MKICQNRFVLIAIVSAISLTTLGCKGTGGPPSLGNLFARQSPSESGQSAREVAKSDSQRAKIDFDAAKGSSSKVALASYVSQDQKKNETQWLKSYEEAVQLSKQTGRPILADFTGSNWCSFCIKLKKEILDTPTFKSWAAENVVLLELDFPRPNLQADWIKEQNNQLRSRYKIESYPTVLILHPDGSVIGSQGYMRDGPERWIAVANNTIKTNRALQKTEFVDLADFENRQ